MGLGFGSLPQRWGEGEGGGEGAALRLRVVGVEDDGERLVVALLVYRGGGGDEARQQRAHLGSA